MIPIDKCRELISDNNQCTDEEMHEVVEDLYALAQLAINSYLNKD